MENVPYIIKFAPKTIEQVVLPKRIADDLSGGVVGNMIFYGDPGMGKSLCMKILANDHPNLYVNVSLSGVIDELRDRIATFCEEVCILDDKKFTDKVVMFDEMDKASDKFYDALRGFMDSFPFVKFIGTCNYFQKIPDPVKSRFDCINFLPKDSAEELEMQTKYRSRIKGIFLKGCKLNIADDVLIKMCDNSFPDFRKPLQLAQKLNKNGVTDVTMDVLNFSSYEFIELYELIINGCEPEKFYELLMGDYGTKPYEVLSSLNEGFLRYIRNEKKHLIPCIGDITEIVAHYSDVSSRIDQALAMTACSYKLMNKLATKR